jgi:hypothetical protein
VLKESPTINIIMHHHEGLGPVSVLLSDMQIFIIIIYFIDHINAYMYNENKGTTRIGEYVVTFRDSRVTYKTGLGWRIRLTPYTFTQLGTTGNTALLLIYTLYSSSLHTH